MKKPATIYRFTAQMQRMDGEFHWHFLEFPHDVEKLFGTKGNFRVRGTINGVAVDRSLVPTKSGIHIIIVGGDIRRAAKLSKVGDIAEVHLWPHEAPEKPDLPIELSETLDFLPEMKAAWDKLKPGRQRNMCIWIGGAKTAATRAKRIAELLKRLETGEGWVGMGQRP